eukprot:m.38114 g.38114  ORF g.38114 m.38114 type:complete len:120 (-) comp7777_c0_seq1:4857-5216(-)
MPSADKKYDPHAFVESTSSFGDALFSGKIPCARGAFLNGIGAGVALGTVWLVQSRMVQRSVGVAVKTFALVGIGSMAYCQRQRELEIAAVKQTVEALNRAEQMKLNGIQGESTNAPRAS